MRHHVSWYTLREGREKGEGKIERKERKREARVKAELLKKQWGEGVGRVSPLSRYLHRPVFIFKHPSEIEREATDPFRSSMFLHEIYGIFLTFAMFSISALVYKHWTS